MASSSPGSGRTSHVRGPRRVRPAEGRDPASDQAVAGAARAADPSPDRPSAPVAAVAAVPAVASVPAPGVVVFGRYRLDERLGLGGMAEVWRAHDMDLDRQVVLKLLHRHLLPDERSRTRFAAEARASAGLSHPGVVTVHDIVIDNEQAAIVMELVDGETLSDFMGRVGKLPEVAAAAIAAQVAHALQAAHDRSLIHRDIKPANVLMSPDGSARLLDFGIARALDDREAALTMPGTIMGTLRYLSPEQLAGERADRSSDIFGLGALLYEMLTGRPPFPAVTPAALIAQQRHGAPTIDGTSPELAGLARSALQADRGGRPRTAGRMAVLLERWLSNREQNPAELAAVTKAALAAAGIAMPAASPAGSQPTAASSGDADLQAPPMGSTPGMPAPNAVTQAATGVVGSGIPASLSAPIRLAGRRVPLIAALGLAGLLLAGLLLAGSFVALQAGSGRPDRTPARTASPTPVATQVVNVAPPVTAKPEPAKPEPAKKTPKPKPPRRDH